jgi:hypothetical protein
MKAFDFNTLINTITNMNCDIIQYSDITENTEIIGNTEYFIVVNELGIINKGFIFKTPKNLDNLVQSFINQFCTKLKKQKIEFIGMKHFTLSHHLENNYTLKNIIIHNFTNKETLNTYYKYALYPTTYGIGISTYLIDVEKLKINALFDFLELNKIPFKNEFSEKEFAFRFKISKDIEFNKSILSKLN